MGIALDRRQFLLGAIGLASSAVLSGCDSQDPAERVYIDEAEIDAMFAKPDGYKGKWVKLPGKVLGASSKDGDTTALQAYYDIVTLDRTYIVRSDTTSEAFAGDEFIFVDGKIDGTFTGENSFGTEVTVPLITNAEITKSSYIDTVAPATTVIEPAVSVTQNDVVFSCDKVEYAASETRVYLTVNNATPEGLQFGAYGICLLAGGQQVSQDNSSMGRYSDPGSYPELGYDLVAGASTSGVAVFPKMDAGQAFQIIIPDIMSDDYTVTFEDVTLDIPAA